MKYALLVSLIFGFQIANAKVSERNFQAGMGQNYFQGNLNYEMNSWKVGDDGFGQSADFDLNDFIVNAHFERGFNEQFAVYFGIGYGSAELDLEGDDDVDFKGLNPINLGVKAQKVSEYGRFFGRLNGAYGLEKGDEENRTNNVFALNLKVGYEHFINDSSIVGGSVALTVISTDAKFEAEDGIPEDDEETKGNAEISVYYEKTNANGLVLGGHLDYEKTTILSFVDYHQDGFDFSLVELGAYARLPVSENVFLLGSLDYGFSVNEPTGFEELSRFRLSAGARVLF